jgi:hypothetical protein
VDKSKSDHTSLRRYLPDISNISFVNYELDWLGTRLQGFGFWHGKISLCHMIPIASGTYAVGTGHSFPKNKFARA